MGQGLDLGDFLTKSILKPDVLDKMPLTSIIANLTVTLLVAMFVFFIYKKTFKGVVYSHNYNVSLVLMSMVTTLIIMLISTSLILSLGMLGALSIVRFRTALKDPMDIVFMFWSIAIGITCGAGFHPLAITGSLFIGITLFVLSKYTLKDTTYLLIINYFDNANEAVSQRLEALDYTLKSKTVSNERTELTVEVKVKDGKTAFVNEISAIEGVRDAVLVSYNGDYVA